jgi:hypothetical protein
MDLKNAAAVCLISLFSATLVVLIARMLDSQAASQIEPQLASIAKDIHAIRKQGGFAAAPSGTSAADNGFVVYYFHSNKRCETCRAIESQAREVLYADFAPQLDREEIAWEVLNFQKPSGKKLAEKFDVKDPVVVLAKVEDGEITTFKRLDNCMMLANDSDKGALTKYLREEMHKTLPAAKPSPAVEKKPAAGKEELPSQGPPNIPIPK